jgi:arginyl-tRNA synthetase
MRIYIKFNNEATPELEEQARKELVKVQKKDPENYALYQEFIEYSMTEYDSIYKRLDINIEETIGESFYNDMMPTTVKTMLDNNLAKVDDGAVMVFFDEETKVHPAMLQKSDGAFGYTASDLSAVIYRYDT